MLLAGLRVHKDLAPVRGVGFVIRAVQRRRRGCVGVVVLQEMVGDDVRHSAGLGAQVDPVPVAGVDQERLAAFDSHSQRRQRVELEWVVRQEANTGHPEVLQDAWHRVVRPHLILEAKLAIRLDCVQALVLEGVRSDLVRQPNAAPLLLQVHNDSPALGGQPRKGLLELLSAVATLGAKDFRCETLVVDAQKDVSTGHVSHNNHSGLLVAVPVRPQSKFSPPCRQGTLRDELRVAVRRRRHIHHHTCTPSLGALLPLPGHEGARRSHGNQEGKRTSAKHAQH
mmetsp:Transcript_3425/g.9971  ORF Transcript_3425/g.9971 Transcript_3425/m.9971 type:complete len:282 (+) Transcript_3425:1149-1994(+)